MFLATAWMDDVHPTLFLAGYDPSTGAGGPPEIVEGGPVVGDGDIVLDRSFAAKYRVRVGQGIRIGDDTLRVAGFSGGTNAFVIQYGFVSLSRARAIVGYPSIVSFYMVRLVPGAGIDTVRGAIMRDVPGVSVYGNGEFLENNVREMESGFMPILYAIAAIGAVVLTSILTLLLSVIILESRHDFAVMRALGAPDGFLTGVVLAQAFVLSGAGTAAAVILFPLLASAIEFLSPEVSARGSLLQTVSVSFVVLWITLFSALLAVRRLRTIYPLEAFT